MYQHFPVLAQSRKITATQDNQYKDSYSQCSGDLPEHPFSPQSVQGSPAPGHSAASTPDLRQAGCRSEKSLCLKASYLQAVLKLSDDLWKFQLLLLVNWEATTNKHSSVRTQERCLTSSRWKWACSTHHRPPKLLQKTHKAAHTPKAMQGWFCSPQLPARGLLT